MKIRHFLLLLVVVMSSWAVGCAPQGGGMDYLDTGGRGEVKGEMSGVAFSALVELLPMGEGVSVEYLSPDSICGLKFLAKGDECQVTLGELSFVCSTHEVAGFLRPATAFLLYGDANSLQRDGENLVLHFSAKGTLTLSSAGTPISLVRDDIRLQVVWWEEGGC